MDFELERIWADVDEEIYEGTCGNAHARLEIHRVTLHASDPGFGRGSEWEAVLTFSRRRWRVLQEAYVRTTERQISREAALEAGRAELARIVTSRWPLLLRWWWLRHPLRFRRARRFWKHPVSPEIETWLQCPWSHDKVAGAGEGGPHEQ